MALIEVGLRTDIRVAREVFGLEVDDQGHVVQADFQGQESWRDALPRFSQFRWAALQVVDHLYGHGWAFAIKGDVMGFSVSFWAPGALRPFRAHARTEALAICQAALLAAEAREEVADRAA